MLEKVVVVLLVTLFTTPVQARAQRSCLHFAETALECHDVEDPGYEKILRRYCQSIYTDTRILMRPNLLRKELRSAIREVTCAAMQVRGPFAALDDAITDFLGDHDIERNFEEDGIPARRRRWLAVQAMRGELVSYPHLQDCPAYDDRRMPETRICRYHAPDSPRDDRPDVVLILSGGMITGMNLLQHAAKVVISALAERFDVWAYTAEAAPLHWYDIRALRWQIANLARGFVEEHPGTKVVLLGFSIGAAQIIHAINEVLPRNRFAEARPALAILLDIVDSTPFISRTITLAPGITKVLAFHGVYATPSPPIHGAHRLRCIDPDACAIHTVRQAGGPVAAHIEVPELVANSPTYRNLLIDALDEALP